MYLKRYEHKDHKEFEKNLRPFQLILIETVKPYQVNYLDIFDFWLRNSSERDFNTVFNILNQI